MRRLLVLLSVLLSFVLAAPALAAAGWEEVRDRLVPLPPGFVETNEANAINGKINMTDLMSAAGEEMPDGLSKDDIAELNDAGFARTLINQEQGDVLVIMGFRANNDEDAGYIVEGMLDSATEDSEMKKDEAASTDDVHVYSMTSTQANGQAAVIRKGKFAYLFLVANQKTVANKDLAKNLATQQLAALPAGSTEVGGDEASSAVVALVIFGILIALVVFLLVRRANKRAKEAEANRLAESGSGVDQPGAVEGVGTGYAEVGSSGTDPLAGGPPADPPLSQ